MQILRGCCCSECRSKQTLIYKALERAITQFGFWLVTHTAAQFQIIPILMCIAATCQDWLALLHGMGILYALHLNSWVLLRVMLQRSGMPFPDLASYAFSLMGYPWDPSCINDARISMLDKPGWMNNNFVRVSYISIYWAHVATGIPPHWLNNIISIYSGLSHCKWPRMLLPCSRGVTMDHITRTVWSLNRCHSSMPLILI